MHARSGNVLVPCAAETYKVTVQWKTRVSQHTALWLQQTLWLLCAGHCQVFSIQLWSLSLLEFQVQWHISYFLNSLHHQIASISSCGCWLKAESRDIISKGRKLTGKTSLGRRGWHIDPGGRTIPRQKEQNTHRPQGREECDWYSRSADIIEHSNSRQSVLACVSLTSALQGLFERRFENIGFC